MIRFLAIVLSVILSNVALADGWIQQSDFGGVARHRTPMIVLGNCIYTGQGHYNGGGTNILFDDWWQYDPATNSWSQKADYLGGNVYHAVGFAIDDIGYVGTGRAQPGGIGTQYFHVSDFYKYDPTSNSWTQIASLPGPGRRGGVAFVVNGYGYVGTGESLNGVEYNDFYRYNPVNDSWIQISSVPTGGKVSAVGFSIGEYGYFGTGGLSSWGSSTTDFWRYDPVNDQWTQMADVGTIPRMEATGFSLNGKGYILCGDNYSSGTNYEDMYEYEPSTNTWTQLEDFPGTARRYMAAVDYNGVAYCGLGTNGTNFKDFWKYDPVLALIEKNLENVSITAFPNPATDHINIQLHMDNEIPLEKMDLKIISMSGKLVYDQPITSSEKIINTQSFSSENYIFSVVYNNQIIKSGQFSVY